MNDNHSRSWLFRVIARLLLLGQVVVPVPAVAVTETPQEKAKPSVAPAKPPASPPPIRVNRTVPVVAAPSAFPRFSADPTDEEVFRARVFEEPLVAVGGATSVRENRALAASLMSYLQAGAPEDVSAVTAFLKAHPKSPWRASILTNLGIVYRHTGYYSRALGAWQEAWDLAKPESDPQAHAVADRALGDLMELSARLGRQDALEALFAETEDRDVRGSASEKVSGARQGLWAMKNRSGGAFRCGPLAVGRVLAALRPEERSNETVRALLSTSQGTSLSQLQDLADRVGLKMRMAFRSNDADIIVPAVVHWKAGHFAALVGKEGERYLLQDPTFGEDIWVSRRALEDEGSGYFLVATASLPAGWRDVAVEEGGSVWGKGAMYGVDPTQIKCSSTAEGGDAGGCSGDKCLFMARYKVHAEVVSLNVIDTPVGYTAPVGPAVQFTVTYNQRDLYQPQLFSYANLGAKWTFGWLSYVTDNPSSPGLPVNVYLRGGGLEAYSSGPNVDSRAVVVLITSSPIRYERQLPDGSKEVFTQPDGASTYPRKVFMTQYVDPQGNALTFTYDASLRLVAVTDAVGQVTTVSYGPPTNSLKISQVTDPFGRSANFIYDAQGRLSQITDVIGISSAFNYGSGDFVSSLTTPYGETKFLNYDVSGTRRIEILDPVGAAEMLEYIPFVSWIAPTDPSPPTGMFVDNWNLGWNNTFYWDKRAMALYAGDMTKAKIIHWANVVDGDVTAVNGQISSLKRPLENRVWYSYPGEGPNYPGTATQPAAIGRVLDDATSQVYKNEYNAIGKKTKEIDPLGRETDYFYGTNNVIDPNQTTGTGIDLLQVKQKNGAGFDLVETRAYNAQHLPLTVTNAAGQATTYTYLSDGRVQTVVTPPRGGLTQAERTTTYTYYPDTAPTGAGRVQTVTGPATGATTTYEYDAFGRVSKVTDSEGYAINTAYDALDRPTTVTYPDGTYEQTIYNRLDAEQRRDRLGRWNRRFYDALRRVVAMRDAQGHTTTYVWCNCGSLDAIRDGNGNTTSWQRDVQGRPTQETRADNSFTTSIYENTTSRLKSVTDARNQTKTYGYAIDNKLTSTTYTNFVVATPNVSFSYMDPDNPSVPDPYGRLRLMTDGIGTTRYDYKPVATLGAGSLSSVDGPLANDTVSYTYDELGRVTTRGLSTFSTTWGYDVLGRLGTLSSPSLPMGNFGWTYVNTTGRPQTVTYPNNQVTTYTYFPNLGDQRLQQIKHQQTSGGTVLSQFDYTYDAVGNIKTWTQQRGTDPAKVYTLGYDPADELATATVSGPNPLPVPSRFRYAYDNAGNRSAEELDDAVTGATYNNLNQLTSRQPGGTVLFRGTVSEPATVTVQGKPAQVASDNTFAAQAQVGSGATNVAVVATDPSGNTRTNTYQVSESGSTTNYTYDQDGNLAGDGTRTFEWDAENRLTAVKQGATTLASFTYDGHGRRAQKIAGGVTHAYVYDDANIIEERLSSGQTYDYIQGPRTDQPLAMRDQVSVVSYYLADHLGSIVQTTNSTGAVVLTREYDPWGNPIQGSTTAGYAFTGRDWDPEASLYYYRARYYDPKIGRFISADPLLTRSGLPSSWVVLKDALGQPYNYVDNDPVGSVDPSGMAKSPRSRDCSNTSPECKSMYGPCEPYLGRNLRCFCECMGNDPWAQEVRCCLWEYKQAGYDPHTAHAACYLLATKHHPRSIPGDDLARCYKVCGEAQVYGCGPCQYLW